jgi:hypothetical protein
MSENHGLPVGIRIEGSCGDIRIRNNKFVGIQPVVIGPAGKVSDLEYSGNDSRFSTQRLRLSEKDIQELKNFLETNRSQLEAAGPSNFEAVLRILPMFGRFSAKTLELGANASTIVAYARDLFFHR